MTITAPFTAVLTLEKHKKGIWVTKLVDEIRRLQHPVQVVTLESLDLDRFETCASPPWIALVNRVSDAADPVLAKSCQSVLNTAALWGIPCFNGPRSYSIGSNKTLHHHVFAKAGCRTPRSVKIRFGFGATAGDADAKEKLISAARILLQERGCEWPLLIKPNSAGFGNGIKLFSALDELAAYGDTLSSNDLGPSEDGVALLQEYIEPQSGSIYRVWFLSGKVQCAVQRSVEGIADSNQTPVNDFTSGCAGGNSCSLFDRRRRKKKMMDGTRNNHSNVANETNGCAGNACPLASNHDDGRKAPSKFRAWSVPKDVSNDISRVLSVVGDDCDAGSVELLYDESGNRIYFDLNMLSTLPITDDGSVDNSEKVWPGEGVAYDPWSELAEAVIEKVNFAI